MVRYALALCSFAFATCEFAAVGVLPELARNFDVSLPAAGLLISAYMAVIAIGGPLLTIAGARFNRRTLIVSAVALGLVFNLITLIAPNYTVLLLARMGVAAGQAVFLAVALEVAAVSVPIESRASAIATVMNGFALANVVSLPVSALAGAHFGWHWCFAAVTWLMAGSLAVIIATPMPATKGARVDARNAPRAFTERNVVLGVSTTVLTFTAVTAVVAYIMPILRDVARLSTPWASAGLLLYGAGTVVGASLGGRVPTAQIVRVLPLPIALVTVLLVAQQLALREAAGALVWLFLLGLCVMAAAPLLQTWVMSHVEGGASGIAGSVNISAFAFAAVLGPMLGGEIIAAGVGLQHVGTAAAVPALGAAVLAVRLHHRHRSAPNRVSPVDVRTPE
jgi:DHA1 family inner membrane transport protein